MAFDLIERKALICAMHVRNELEQIHGRDDGTLPDSIMKEVNTIVRDSIYSMLRLMAEFIEDPLSETEGYSNSRLIGHTIMSIPPYWEGPRFNLTR